MDMLRRLFQKARKSTGGSIIYEHAQAREALKLGFSKAPVEWRGAREAHYRRWFGEQEVTVWHEVVPAIPHIDVWVFPPSEQLQRSFYTLITSGMSDERMMLPPGIDKELARAEVVFYVAEDLAPDRTERPWFVQTIFFFAHFPFTYKTWLAPSHTIPNGNPPAPIVEGSLLTTAIFLPAIFEAEGFVKDFRLDGEKVNFLWLTFISDKETQYKLNEGYDKFVGKLNKDNFPQVFDAFRPSVV